MTQITYNDPCFTARAASYPICLEATSPVARLNGLSHKEQIPFTARVPLPPPPPVNRTAPYHGTVQSVAGEWNRLCHITHKIVYTYYVYIYIYTVQDANHHGNVRNINNSYTLNIMPELGVIYIHMHLQQVR